MDRNTAAVLRAEIHAVIRYALEGVEPGNKSSERAARAIESDARAMLARLPEPRRKLKKSNKAMKRKAFKHCVRLDANAPIFPQVQAVVR